MAMTLSAVGAGLGGGEPLLVHSLGVPVEEVASEHVELAAHLVGVLREADRGQGQAGSWLGVGGVDDLGDRCAAADQVSVCVGKVVAG
ncbi:hypothetical protein [Micromonospora sp. NBC_01638]|uniref:hypothetical protein n=1 Tax=Micromonospora sp. NBC_01638 TaxID=2975982 RepID=UPI0038698A3B|nr:hypothetical protein OG811_00235 [Micromonospora sp. NBC_01638]